MPVTRRERVQNLEPPACEAEEPMAKRKQMASEKTAAPESKRLELDLHNVKIPHSLLSDLMQFGFIEQKHNKKHSTYFPIIQIHPLFAPRDVKVQWITMYKDAKLNKSPWKRLVYKYGANDVLFKPAPDIISFKEGVDKNYDAIPLEIMEKLRKGKKLTSIEVDLIEALEILKKENQMQENNRVQWLQINRDMDNGAAKVPIPNDSELAVVHDVDSDDDDDNEDDKDDPDNALKEFVFSRLNQGISSDFRRVCFARYDGEYFPVIQISPFDLCPSSMFRCNWFRKFKMINSGKEDWRMVYWYGQPRDDAMIDISMVKGMNICSYFEGCQNLKQSGRDENDDYVKNAMEEAAEDLKLLPEQRLKWFFNREKEKKKILSSIPDDLRTDFGRVGFVKSNSQVLPCIQLSPYVPAGSTRTSFIKEIEQGMAKKNEIKRLVFWYGTRKRNANQAFSFISEKKIISYEAGVESKHHVLPPALKEKVDKGARLTVLEKVLVDGLKQMDNDLKFSQIERPGILMLPNSDDEVAEYLKFDMHCQEIDI